MRNHDAVLVFQKISEKNPSAKAFLKDIKDLPYSIQAAKSNTWMQEHQIELQSIKSLDLTKLNIYTLPPEIKFLTELTSLNLSDTSLTTLPKEIGNLAQLEGLDLSNTSLKTLPKEIGNLTQLKELDLCHTPLTELPKEIESLQAAGKGLFVETILKLKLYSH